jgi:hypothetical protein
MNDIKYLCVGGTRRYPRTMLEAFPHDRAEYACALHIAAPAVPVTLGTVAVSLVLWSCTVVAARLWFMV